MRTAGYQKWQKKLARILFVAILLGTAEVPVMPATAQTKAITVDFEDGDGGFTGRGAAVAVVTDENAWSGNYLSGSGGTESWNGAQKDLSDLVSGNDVLKVSAYVRNNEAYEITSHMTLQEEKTDGTTAYSWIQGDVVIAPGEWKQLSGTITVASNTRIPVLYFETKEVGVSFSIDQVEITIETEEKVEEPEVDIGEPGGRTIDFEDGQIYFDKMGNPELQITRSEGYQGSAGLLVSNRSESYEGPLKDVSAFLEKGETLSGTSVSAAALVKNLSEKQRRAAITLRLTKEDGTQEYQTLAWVEAEAGSWVSLSCENGYTIGQGVASAAVYIEVEGTDPFIVDCVSLAAGKAANPVQPLDPVTPSDPVTPFENLLIDFEDGNPWFTDRGDAKGEVVPDAFRGEKALAVTGRTQNWHGVEKDLSQASLEGKGLRSSFWVKNTSSRIADIYLTLQETDAEGNVSYTRIAGGETLPGNWISLEGGVNIQPQTVCPMIYFESSDSSASFVIDDVNLQTTQWIEESEAPDGSNTDGGASAAAEQKRSSVAPFSVLTIDFEDGSPFFDNRGEGKAAISSQAHGGSKALSVSGRTLSWHGVERDFTDAGLQGKYLHVSFWTKHEKSEPQEIRFCIQEEDAAGEISYHWIAAGSDIKKGEWTQVTGEYLVREKTGKIVLYFEATDPELAFLIDDVELKSDMQPAAQPDKEKKESGPVWIKNLGQTYIETVKKIPWKQVSVCALTIGILSVGGIGIQKKRKKEIRKFEDKNI